MRTRAESVQFAVRTAALLIAAVLLHEAGCSRPAPSRVPPPVPSAPSAQAPPVATPTPDTAHVAQPVASESTVAPRAPEPPRVLSDSERAFFVALATDEWRYVVKYYQSSTGLVNATPDWPNTTLWDVGGQILALISARDVGIVTDDDFARRMTRVLATLEKLPLYQNAAFNKVYSTRTGARSSGGRPGWTTTDLGRCFIALKILATREPRYAEQAERIVRRNDFTRLVQDGYLRGLKPGSHGKLVSYQEGRIGYEQYAASGFHLWGADVGDALDVNKNAEPADVLGVPILADRRYDDRLLSEPFILYGLELGLSGAMKDLAMNVLKAQEARYAATGQITIATEDALALPPEYFYYYCVYCGRKPFVVEMSAPGRQRDKPRWVSTKGAFGWNAIMPDDYTRKAVAYVAPAHDAKRGWASGVMEKTRTSTRTYDINTAAVLLEIAAFELRGGVPLIQPSAGVAAK